MRALITNNLISKLSPKDKQYDVRDTKLAGFLIRVNPSGKMVYVCQYKRGRRITIGKVGVISPAQARDRAVAILGDAAKGVDPTIPTKKSKQHTLKEFLEKEYHDWIMEQRKSGKKTYDQIKRNFIKSFGKRELNEITPVLLEQWRTTRLKDGVTISTVNRDIAVLKAALSKAVLWGLIDKHPLEKLKLLKTDRSIKVRYLSSEEEKNLRNTLIDRETLIRRQRASGNEWRKERNYELLRDLYQYAYADYLRPMVLLSINTGMRRGELFSLQWVNVSFDLSILTVEGAYAKSGKTRHIPLNSEALQILKDWKKQSTESELVFPNEEGKPFDTLKTAWKHLMEAAKIKNFRWHDMRHHFASKLVMAGVDLNTVRELLGHADISTTLRYAHLAPEHKANAVEKLTQEVVNL